MVKSSVKLSGVFFTVGLLLACSSANNKPLLIDFSADSTSIIFNHIDQTGLLQLQTLKNGDSSFNNLISVLQIPSERDSTLKELPLEGKVMVTDSTLVFIPDTPFIKGRDYLVITHLNARFGSIEKMLKGELRYGVKPLQKLLTK
jgi:hypothetical protein